MDETRERNSVVEVPVSGGVALDDGDREMAGLVEQFITALLKEFRARQAYVSGNPLIDRFHNAVVDQLYRLWELAPHLTLTIDEGRLLWRDQPVYDHPIGHDNFAFMFFRDGLRVIAFLPGCEQGELREFLDIVASYRQGRTSDLLATLWHRDFSFVRVEYVDVTEDETLELPVANRNAGDGETISDMTEIERVIEAGPVDAEVDTGFSELLLSDADQLYLQREMDLELERPLAHDVTLALLDQFEMRDQERRRQVVDILRELLPRLLREPDFGTVALIVNELQLLANRTGERDTQDLVVSLLRDMSEAMAELVSLSLDDGATIPKEEEMEALLGALQAEAIPTLVRALPSMADPAQRDQIEDVLDRLVEKFPAQITELLSADDPMLAAEAAAIIARLGFVDCADDLLSLADRNETVARRAAIEALGAMPGELAGPVVIKAMGDDDISVRRAAVASAGRLRLPEAGPALAKLIGARRFEQRDQAEQMAFLKGLVAAWGVRAVPLVGKLLNGRRWWGGRRAPGLRASAARALAVIGSPEATAHLEKAKGDPNASVANAVRLSLRHLEQGAGEMAAGEETPAVIEGPYDERGGR